MKKLLFASSLFLALLMGALHFEFQTAEADEQINGAGSTYWSIDQAIGSNSDASTQCVHRTDSLSTCAIFPAGSEQDAADKATLVSASAAGRCCWVMDKDLLIHGGRVLDTGFGSGDGQCAGFKLPVAGYEADESPSWGALIQARAAGMRTGLCAVASGSPTSQVTNDVLHMPCDADGDCPSGTCDLVPTNEEKANAGVYMICRGNTTTSSVTFSVRKQKVRKR